ncbi:MAG: beta strand repeat-containing protein, partial [Puniceicoccales bacterium]
MKQTHPSITKLPSCGKRASALIAGCALIGSSLAAQSTLYWDAGSAPGGTGTWDQGTSANWSASPGGGSTIVWTAGDYAIFGGTSGTVTVDGSVNVGARSGKDGLEFTAGGYTLTGGTILLTPNFNNSSIGVIDFSAGSGDVVIHSDFVLDYSIRTNGNGELTIVNRTGNTLELNGDFDFSATNSTQAKWLSLSQTDVGGSIVYNGSTTTSGTENTALRVGYSGVNGANYYLNGDNSGLSGGNSADLTRGNVYVGNALALGTGTVRLGNSSSSSDIVQLLTNDAIVVGNTIQLSGDASSTKVVGGGSANNSEFSGKIDLYINSSNEYNVQVTAEAGGRTDFSGQISDDGGTSGSVEKIGAGVVRFTRASGNDYDGGTTVSAGTLLAMNTSGSATGTGSVIVADGATLGGDGFVTGAVTANAAGSRFAAGDTDAIGTFTMSGGLTANSGATFVYDIDGTSVDSIDFGSASVTLDSTLTFDFNNLGTVDTGVAYSLFEGTGTWTDNGVIFDFNGPDGYALDSSYGDGDGYVWDADGNSLTVQFAAIPEPASMGLYAVGFVALCVM